MLPGEYEFGTADKELMEILSGELEVLLPGQSAWKAVKGGESFEVAANAKFKLKVSKAVRLLLFVHQGINGVSGRCRSGLRSGGCSLFNANEATIVLPESNAFKEIHYFEGGTMRLLLCAALVIVFGLVGCQQKQASNKQVVAPPQAMITAQQVENLRSLAKMNPGKADGWIALGNALMDTQQFSEAIDAYQKALALDPKNVDVRVDMGTCLRGMGKPEAAVAEFRKALAIAPGHLNAHRNLGVVLGLTSRTGREPSRSSRRSSNSRRTHRMPPRSKR